MAISSVAEAPELSEFFERGSLLRLLVRGHPYDFIETYRILRTAYGYSSYYVNLGLWELAADSKLNLLADPAQRLVRLLVDKSGLSSARRIVDVGSGLGQGAIDLARWLEAERVLGVNLNERQIRFANALARSAGMQDVIEHSKLDACGGLERHLGSGCHDLVTAVECAGHFKRPDRFLKSVHALLRPGGSFVFCLNVAKEESLPLAFRAMIRATYGFVPRSTAEWIERLRTAGFTGIRSGDLTSAVLDAGTRHVLERLGRDEIRDQISPATAFFVRRQLRITRDAVRDGRLGYGWISARKP